MRRQAFRSTKFGQWQERSERSHPAFTAVLEVLAFGGIMFLIFGPSYYAFGGDVLEVLVIGLAGFMILTAVWHVGYIRWKNRNTPNDQTGAYEPPSR